MKKKTLIIDNNIDRPWGLCADIRRYLDEVVIVRRAPQEDLPKTLEGFTHVILSGSKTSPIDSAPWIDKLIRFVEHAIEAEIPVLGICYGHQLIARTLGGIECVGKSATPEIGWVEIRQTKPENPLLQGLPDVFYSFQSHYDEVCAVPKNCIATAESSRCGIQAYYMAEKPVFGIQFHPERNAQEGQASIERNKKVARKDCVFGDGKAKLVFNENVATTIFKNFLSIKQGHKHGKH